MKTTFKLAARLGLLAAVALSFAFCGGPSAKHQASKYAKTKDRIEAYATKNAKLKADIKAKVAEFDKAHAEIKKLAADKQGAALKGLVSRMEAYEKALKPAAKPTKAKVDPKKATKKAPAKVTAKAPAAKCLELSTATAASLTKLKGIGPALAKRIIDFRAKQRTAATKAGKAKWNFRNWATLLKVPGLSAKICTDNRAAVCFSGRVQKTCPTAVTKAPAAAAKKAPATAVKKAPAAPKKAPVAVKKVPAPAKKVAPKAKKVAPKAKKSKSGLGGK